MDNKLIKRTITILLLSMALLGAFAQQDTRYHSELNLPFNQKAGDINPQTGDVTLGVTDSSTIA